MSDAESLESLEKLAGEGDADAAFRLGNAYSTGEGVEKSLPKAKKYLAESAEKGSVPAMEKIADIYSDEKKGDWAVFVNHWYRKAILGGSDTAIVKLADYYYLGDGNSNKHAALLYLEYAKRHDDDCDRAISILTRMLESNWLDGEWKFFADILEVLAEHGNRDAKHMIRREEVPEPTDTYDFQTLVEEEYELPEVEEEAEKPKQVRHWGRAIGKRSVTSVLYEMGIEFTKSSNGIIKTKEGKSIEDQMQKLIERGYPFKYQYRSDKWTMVDKKDRKE